MTDDGVADRLRALLEKWRREERMYAGPVQVTLHACANEVGAVLERTAVDAAASWGAISGAREKEDFKAKYYELLYEVGKKFPGESRHETARRYIRERESQALGGPCSAAASLPRQTDADDSQDKRVER